MTLVIGYRVIELLHWAIGLLVIGGTLAASPAIAEAQSSTGQAGSSRLLFGPTGRLLPPGQGYITFDGPLVTVQVGATPRFSIGAGATLLFLFAHEFVGPVWVTPKVQLSAGERTSVAAGALHAFVPGESGSGGLAYVVRTAGTADRSFTIGGAVAYARYGSGGSGAAPMVLLAGERRVTRGRSVITENWLTRGGGMVSMGVRRHGRRVQGHVGFAMGFAYGCCAFPGLTGGVAIKFGGPR